MVKTPLAFARKRNAEKQGNKTEKDTLTNLREIVLMALLNKDKDGATELLCKHILEKNYIYTIRDDKLAEMWIYSEGIYIPQAKTFIREICRKILKEAFTSQICNSVIAKIEADTYIDSKEFFMNSNIEEIAVENGILNIFTKELRAFDPTTIFFNKLPVIYDRQKNCPAILKHLNTVLKHENDVPVMQEIFGYLLLKEYRIEKAFMFSGSGRNGKSKTLEIMKRFIGVRNCSNIPLQNFDTDAFAKGELLNKLANLSPDVSSKALTQTGELKSLTGRDLLSAQRKFLPRVEFVNHAKMIFCANELPKTYDLTPAFWDRWILIEFPYRFVSEKEMKILGDEEKETCKLMDPNIIGKLTTADELSGLLNFALEGLDRLLKNNDFSYSKSVDDVKKMWIRKSDSFSYFLDECAEEDGEANITKQELKKAYSLYCKKHKLKMLGDKAIKQTVTTKFGIIEDRISMNGKQVSCWAGLRFKSSWGSKDSDGFSTYIENSN